ncbi:MAG: NADH-quinone oxidoreductase subunit NuoN, partial [Pseudomonadota bacterium]
MEQDLMIAAPEIAMAIGAMALLMFGAYGGGDAQRHTVTNASALLMVLVAAGVATAGAGERIAFSGMFIDDGFARFAKMLILIASALMLLIGRDYLERRGVLRFEYPILIVLATLGMMFMVSAGGLIALYVGLELQSLALYVVAAFNRDSARSTEAGLKYFVLGALSSGLLLYGASLVYGYTGTTNFGGIAQVIEAEGVSLGLTFGLVFLCAALAFKISAAPFHMWTPDVYEGSPTAVTAFFATAPKVAAGVLFARVLYEGFGDAVPEWSQILIFVAVASMFLGAIAAIGQTNLKRLLAYSSIGHMGYALVGLAAGTPQGAEALLVYLAIYVVMNLGTFAFVLSMERDGAPTATIE